nr:FkbM family methyltransferase [Mesorhizobium sp. LNHC220B00]
MKIAVYTIALNEAANAERWANSAVDADYRIVADTGSTDDTVERLTAAGVTVHRIAVRPWRFDDARNAAMALLPADVDVCCTMDMDRFLEPGWRPKLEAAWTSETTALYCQTVYKASVDDPTPLRSWPAKNFHHRWGYRFKRPVHEALVFTGEREVTANSSDLVMFEVQDLAKPTRSSYLPLMEVAHKEDADDAQICFWLGRDLMWANQHERAIPLLERYLVLPTSKWAEERSEAMRYIARMLPEQRLSWLDKARMEAPHRREIWLDLAEEYHGKGDWLNLFWACTNGIEKTHRTGSYLDDANCWGFRLFDLGAIASWHLNAIDRAVEWGQNALDLDQRNERLKNNVSFFTNLRAELAGRSTTPIPLREIAQNGTTVSTRIDGTAISFYVTNKNDEIMKFHYNGEFYEKEELEMIKRHFNNSCGTFLDIGASVGNHTIFASKILNAKRIIPIEPNNVAINVLKRNVSLNKCGNVDTSFLGIALSDESSRLRKATPDLNNIGHTVYSKDASGETSAVLGDELLSGEWVGFIKIDVEGMEIAILSGLRRTIENSRPIIFIEVWDLRLHDFVEWCERVSYQFIDEYRRYSVMNNYLVRPMEQIAAEAKAGSVEHEFCSLLEGKVSGDAASFAWRQLAERYRDSGRGLQAAVIFCRWARMATSPEERWYARWQMANCLHADDGEQFLKSTLETFRARPHRAEPLYTLARHYLRQSRGDIAVGYAEAGLCLGIPESDSAGVEPEIYLTGLKEIFTIAATYSNDTAQKERGRRVCNWLSMDPAIPASVRNLARFNYKWYAERADRYFPSICFHQLFIVAPEGYKPGNVSVARDGAGFVILVRAVNYDHLESGYFDRHGDTSFRQRTLLLRLDEQLNVISSSEVLPPEDMPQPLHLDSLGFEDPRPFVWRNQLWCLSSVRQLNPEGRAEMVLARVKVTSASEYMLSNWQVLPSGTSPQWEKNWMPQVLGDELRLVYSVDPTRIITERGETLFEEKAAIAAENFRGGTQIIPFDDGGLMLIHEWELSGSRRNYFHRFIWLDANNRLARLTLRFFFRRVASEFAAGLAWNVAGTHLIISFGTDDRDPALAIVSADEVRSALLEIDSHRDASDQICEASRSKWEAMTQRS